MAPDAELVRRKMAQILDDLRLLGPIAARALDEHLADPIHELAAERLLERMIGRMIDINFHLVVAARGVPPRDYRQSFLMLAELGVVPAAEAAELAKAAGLRNRLAHEYDAIDPAIVHAAAADAARDVPRYLNAIDAALS